jgi:hypothetical protein
MMIIRHNHPNFAGTNRDYNSDFLTYPKFLWSDLQIKFGNGALPRQYPGRHLYFISS